MTSKRRREDSKEEDAPVNAFHGKVVTLVGTFTNKAEIVAKLEQHGALIIDSVTKKVDLVVASDRALADTAPTQKLLLAEKYKISVHPASFIDNEIARFPSKTIVIPSPTTSKSPPRKRRKLNDNVEKDTATSNGHQQPIGDDTGQNESMHKSINIPENVNEIDLNQQGFLPPEIWAEIFQKLDRSSIMNCKLVCKHFCEIIRLYVYIPTLLYRSTTTLHMKKGTPIDELKTASPLPSSQVALCYTKKADLSQLKLFATFAGSPFESYESDTNFCRQVKHTKTLKHVFKRASGQDYVIIARKTSSNSGSKGYQLWGNFEIFKGGHLFWPDLFKFTFAQLTEMGICVSFQIVEASDTKKSKSKQKSKSPSTLTSRRALSLPVSEVISPADEQIKPPEKAYHLLMEISLDYKQLQYYVATTEEIGPDERRVLELLSTSEFCLQNSNLYKLPTHPELLHRTTEHEQPVGISIQLMKHQKKALAWLVSTERLLYHGYYEFPSVIQLPSNTGYLYIPADVATRQTVEQKQLKKFKNNGAKKDPRLYQCVQYSKRKPEVSQCYTGRMNIRGGFFADGAGIGKTVSLISLIATHRCTPEKLAMMKQETTLSMITPATLVVTHSQLVRQWREEIESISSLKCIEVTTIKQLEHLAQLMSQPTLVSGDAAENGKKTTKETRKGMERKVSIPPTTPDVVILSVAIFSNTTFHKYLSGHHSTTHLINPLEVYWYRIIADEAPEILHNEWIGSYEAVLGSRFGSAESFSKFPGSSLEVNLVGAYKWYVSATPFSLPHVLSSESTEAADMNLTRPIMNRNITHLAQALRFFDNWRFLVRDHEDEEQLIKRLRGPYKLHSFPLLDNNFVVPVWDELDDLWIQLGFYHLFSNFFWRTCKTRCLVDIPDPTEEVHYIILGDTEQLVYDIAELYGDGRIRDCSPSLIPHNLFPYESEIRSSICHLAPHKITFFRERIEKSTIFHFHQLSTADVFTNLMSLKQVLTNLLFIHRTLFESETEPSPEMVAHVEEITSSPIRNLHEISEHSRVHAQAIVDLIDNVCTDEFITRERARLQLLAQNPDFISIKFSAVSDFLRNNADLKKVLIFSQSSDTLKELYAHLRDKVSCGLFGGNVMSRNNRIKSYNLPNTQKSSTRILLMNTVEHSSGLNLQITSDIILLDSSSSLSKMYSQDIQAICRAVRIGATSSLSVHRFICKNTYEEENYVALYQNATVAELSKKPII